MKTSTHELAMMLLDGADVPVLIPGHGLHQRIRVDYLKIDNGTWPFKEPPPFIDHAVLQFYVAPEDCLDPLKSSL